VVAGVQVLCALYIACTDRFFRIGSFFLLRNTCTRRNFRLTRAGDVQRALSDFVGRDYLCSASTGTAERGKDLGVDCPILQRAPQRHQPVAAVSTPPSDAKGRFIFHLENRTHQHRLTPSSRHGARCQ
jgi:hypothetical protein